MTGSSTPRAADSGPLASRSSPTPHRCGLKGLEAILQQRWNEVAVDRDPRIHPIAPAADELPQSLAARLQVLAPVEAGLTMFLDRLESELRLQRECSTALAEEEDLDAETPLSAAPLGMPQIYVQALVGDFNRRQRQANMLVAGCVATSCVLTVLGLAAMAHLAAPSENSSGRTTSMAWRSADPDASGPQLASVSPERTAKADSLFSVVNDNAPQPLAAIPASRAPSPELIMMQPGRPLALGPLIEQQQARYYLIRGLPGEAKLSAGERYPSGAWFVKASDIGSLTLAVGGEAAGDYTAEIYALGTSAIPQGRQRLVFRAETAQPRTAELDADWEPTLRDMALTSSAALDAEVSAVAGLEHASGAGTPEPAWRTKILASLSD